MCHTSFIYNKHIILILTVVFQGLNHRKSLEGVVVAVQVPSHLQSTTEVPLRKVLNLQMLNVSCNELVTYPGMHPVFAHMLGVGTFPLSPKGRYSEKGKAAPCKRMETRRFKLSET